MEQHECQGEKGMETKDVKLNSEKFEIFFRCLSIFKDICNDVDVRNGVIRQRSNCQTAIFQMDLTELISSVADMPLVNLKQKLDLMKSFVGQDVTISFGKKVVKLADKYTSLEFKKPNVDYLDNKYMPKEELEALFTLDEEDVVLKTHFNKTISDRMRVVTSSFSVNSVCVSFQGETAELSATTQSKDQHAKFVTGMLTDRTMECFTNLTVTPFIIDHDADIELKMYNNPDTDVGINKFSTFLDESSSSL